MNTTLKPILLSVIMTISAVGAVLFYSCEQDKCKAVACSYDGVCVQGTCMCQPGYEGANCETISRKKFVSNLWQVKEQGTISTSRIYPLAIEPVADITMVSIKNFYNYFADKSVMATIDKDTIIIPNQQIMGKIVFGKGYIHSSAPGRVNDQITMFYAVIDSANRNQVDDFGYYSGRPSVWN